MALSWDLCLQMEKMEEVAMLAAWCPPGLMQRAQGLVLPPPVPPSHSSCS